LPFISERKCTPRLPRKQGSVGAIPKVTLAPILIVSGPPNGLRIGMIGERRVAAIRPRDIARTRLAALERYGAILNGEEFSRLCVLLRDLAPAVIILMRPQNGPKIMRGDSVAALENLRIVLDGDPDAKPLFGRDARHSSGLAYRSLGGDRL
jgi:hypothetical protein